MHTQLTRSTRSTAGSNGRAKEALDRVEWTDDARTISARTSATQLCVCPPGCQPSTPLSLYGCLCTSYRQQTVNSGYSISYGICLSSKLQSAASAIKHVSALPPLSDSYKLNQHYLLFIEEDSLKSLPKSAALALQP